MILYLVAHGADVKACLAQRPARWSTWRTVRCSVSVRFPETIALLEKLGAKNQHHCVSC